MDNIFQIFLCKEKYREENLREHAEFFETIKRDILAVYPDYQYNLYTNVEAARFVKAFSPEVYKAYWHLAPFAFRADLLRLCLLYEYGGWYFDLTTKPLFKFEPNKDFVASNEGSYNEVLKLERIDALENFVLYAKPKSRFLELCIEEVVKNVLRRKHTKKFTPLQITGPVALKEVFDKYLGIADTVTVGVFDTIQRGIIIDNKMFALHKSYKELKDGLDHLNFKGVNSYNKLCAKNLEYILSWTEKSLMELTDTRPINYD